MGNRETCVVVGAGVAGLWAAWALNSAGMKVIVLDQATAGAGASWGNAGWICPAQAGPLPEPGVIAHGLRNLASRDSALSFTPIAMLRLAPWIARFATYCNQRAYDRGVAALSPLGFQSFAMIEKLGLDEHFDKTGLLTVSKRRADIDHFIEKTSALAQFGQEPPGGVVSGDAVRDIDPAVPSGYHGVLTGNHWQVIPSSYNAALLAKVRAAGVEVLEKRAVTGFDAHRRSVNAVRTTGGSVAADHVVIAAGARTSAVTHQLGFALPVVAGKGYSVDVRPGRMPRQAIQTLDTHVALSPMGAKMRIVGAMDFSNTPTRIVGRRVDALRRAAEGLVGAWTEESPAWAGLRPIAPDGLPLIGRLSADSNVFVATGYSMLGMTISPAAGTLLADAVVSGDDGKLGPFSAQRFTWSAKRSERNP